VATGECHNLIEPPVVKTGSPDAYDRWALAAMLMLCIIG